jgi:hypothetical protein
MWMRCLILVAAVLTGIAISALQEAQTVVDALSAPLLIARECDKIMPEEYDGSVAQAFQDACEFTLRHAYKNLSWRSP